MDDARHTSNGSVPFKANLSQRSPQDREWPEGRLRRALARNKHSCENCAYATRPCGKWFRLVLSQFAGLLICANSAEAPGELRAVPGSSTCPSFRARRRRPTRGEAVVSPNARVRYITLTQDKQAMVDAADYERLNRHKWSLMIRGSNMYAMRTERGKTILMHREIMNPPKGKVVDHIDGNGLNNWRSNLRICDLQQNAWNRRSTTSGSSQYIGVYRRKSRPDKWYACVGSGRTKVILGPFDSEIEAALARDRKAIERYGQFARLNFPGRHYPGGQTADDARCNPEDARPRSPHSPRRISP